MTYPKAFRHKSTLVDAYRMPVVPDPAGVAEAADWAGGAALGDQAVRLDADASRVARLGDWIVRGVDGEYYPVRAAVFEALYVEAPACDGQCLMASDVGLPGSAIAVADPACSLHGPGADPLQMPGSFAEAERAGAAWNRLGANPPAGWFAFGSHVESDAALEFYGAEFSHDGMPLWERPVPPVDVEASLASLFAGWNMSEAVAVARAHLFLAWFDVAPSVPGAVPDPGMVSAVAGLLRRWNMGMLIATRRAGVLLERFAVSEKGNQP